MIVLANNHSLWWNGMQEKSMRLKTEFLTNDHSPRQNEEFKNLKVEKYDNFPLELPLLYLILHYNIGKTA